MSNSTLGPAPALSEVSKSISGVRQSIDDFARKHDREPDSITLLAVSKTKPVAQISAAIGAGQLAFGENYPDEAFEKIAELGDKNCEWHFIGAIQSRKSAGIARHFSWVHSLERLKVARKLSENRPDDMPALQCCLQVNIDGEDTKSGVTPEQVFELAAHVNELPQLELRGLMAIPAPQTDFNRQRDAFARVRQLLDELKKTYTQLDTLSMGMSGDLEAAIAEGATVVRVGTAIFGARAQR